MIDHTLAAAEHRTMNTVIHAAFRRDLQRFDRALGRFGTTAEPRRRADELTAAWANLAHQLHTHHQDEEAYFWPAFRELGVDPALIDALDAEHQRMIEALTEADARMRAFGADPTKASSARAHLAVGQLGDVLDDHLGHEERDLEPFGADHHDREPVKAAVAAARKSHTEGVGTFFAWLDDTDDPQVARALRREVPPPVLFLMTRIGGRRYRRLSASTW